MAGRTRRDSVFAPAEHSSAGWAVLLSTVASANEMFLRRAPNALNCSGSTAWIGMGSSPAAKKKRCGTQSGSTVVCAPAALLTATGASPRAFSCRDFGTVNSRPQTCIGADDSRRQRSASWAVKRVWTLQWACLAQQWERESASAAKRASARPEAKAAGPRLGITTRSAGGAAFAGAVDEPDIRGGGGVGHAESQDGQLEHGAARQARRPVERWTDRDRNVRTDSIFVMRYQRADISKSKFRSSPHLRLSGRPLISALTAPPRAPP